MMPFNLLVLIGVIGVGLFLLPVLLKVLQAVLPVIQEHGAAAARYLAGLARMAFYWAGTLLTKGGRLSPSGAISQVVGSTMMMAIAAILSLADLQLVLATLAPMLGLEFQSLATSGFLAGFDRLMGLSLVLLGATFGFLASDVIGWTSLTGASQASRMRLLAFFGGALCFMASLGVAIALAGVRMQAITETAAGGESLTAWAQPLPGFILLMLAALLFIGVAVALLSIEAFGHTVTALLVAVGGLGLGAFSLTFWMLAFVATLALAGVPALSWAPLTHALHGGASRVGKALSNAGRALAARLRNLVRYEESGIPKGGQPATTPNGSQPAGTEETGTPTAGGSAANTR